MDRMNLQDCFVEKAKEFFMSNHAIGVKEVFEAVSVEKWCNMNELMLEMLPILAKKSTFITYSRHFLAILTVLLKRYDSGIEDSYVQCFYEMPSDLGKIMVFEVFVSARPSCADMIFDQFQLLSAGSMHLATKDAFKDLLELLVKISVTEKAKYSALLSDNTDILPLTMTIQSGKSGLEAFIRNAHNQELGKQGVFKLHTGHAIILRFKSVLENGDREELKDFAQYWKTMELYLEYGLVFPRNSVLKEFTKLPYIIPDHFNLMAVLFKSLPRVHQIHIADYYTIAHVNDSTKLHVLYMIGLFYEKLPSSSPPFDSIARALFDSTIHNPNMDVKCYGDSFKRIVVRVSDNLYHYILKKLCAEAVDLMNPEPFYKLDILRVVLQSRPLETEEVKKRYYRLLLKMTLNRKLRDYLGGIYPDDKLPVDLKQDFEEWNRPLY